MYATQSTNWVRCSILKDRLRYPVLCSLYSSYPPCLLILQCAVWMGCCIPNFQ
ncbi:hypothetical protein JHK82_038466 [Glycine max]|uniref:Uncharacterized protein n=1 Tax=Glycine max TaxID=3847 RepID=K7M486_SOYBN|nr:hypothetical protein JHK87_038413 [Glycine soja]KAG4964241.1 hypothetical protein JHK85_039216 [Glycine max]KAG5109243.1 hypothetical protein JHK82_038466 [Glycine max]KAH1092537.1 hypothetical protein GYH30_038648 [Glycine max]KRH14116.1 hypothetical protein GLYMA_14G007600v4 [Glycine max]